MWNMAKYEAIFRSDTVLITEQIDASSVVEAFKKAQDIAQAQKWFLLSVKWASKT